jgi:hypothetical protein
MPQIAYKCGSRVDGIDVAFKNRRQKSPVAEGIALAKHRVACERKKALTEFQSVELRRRVGAGMQKSTLAREFGISRETLYQYLKVPPTP